MFPRAPPTPLARGATAAVDHHGESRIHGAQAGVANAIAERHQLKKDPKSLGQNLYDTATMIFSYSKHIPSPVSVFASLQSSPVSSFEAAPNTPHRNGRRHSTPNDEHVPSGVFRNGQQVHKIRHVPEPANEKNMSHMPLGPFPLDGTVDKTRSAKSKMTVHVGATSLPARSKKLSTSSTSPGSANGQPTSPEYTKLQVASHLTCDVMDRLKEDVHHHRNEQSADFNFVVDYDTSRKFRPATPFVNRSLFFSLSDPEALLRSFRDEQNEDFADSPLPHLDSYHLTNAFRDWNQRNGALIFDSLCISVDALFRPPPELSTQKSPRLKPSRKGAAARETPAPDHPQASIGRYLSDDEAAHIILICIHALTSLVPTGWPHTWVQVRKFRGWGVVVPGATPQKDFTDGFAHPWLSIVDELEYEPAVRLASRLLRAISARLCFEEVVSNLRARNHDEHSSRTEPKTEHSTSPGDLINILVRHLEVVERNTISRKMKMKVMQDTSEDPGWTVTATFMEWLRTIIIKEWDGKAVFHKWTGVGAAFALLSHFRG